MSGLSLGINAGVRAANPPSNSGSTIGQQAFGITQGSGKSQSGKNCAVASVGIGVLSTAFLVWLYWTLPH